MEWYEFRVRQDLENKCVEGNGSGAIALQSPVEVSQLQRTTNKALIHTV